MNLIPEELGDYVVVDRLAKGGMAEILLAKRRGPMGFEKPVVIKRLLPELTSSPEYTQMFIDEARLAAKLNHPSIVQIHDLGQIGASFFIAMEHLIGVDVAALIRSHRDIGRQVPLPVALFIAAQAADALHYAHELRDNSGNPLGIVHRDVSPQNIFVTRSGVIKVLDFGIAKAQDREVRTRGGFVKGKVQYMPPEQLAGEQIDRRADVYALGVTLFEMLAGRRPFQRDLTSGLWETNVGEGQLRAYRPDVDAELEAIILRTLHPSSRERFANAHDFGTAITTHAIAGGAVASPADVHAILVERFGDHHFAEQEQRVRRGSAVARLPVPPVGTVAVQMVDLMIEQDVAAPVVPVAPSPVALVPRPPTPTPVQAPRQRVTRARVVATLAPVALVCACMLLALRTSLGATTHLLVSSEPVSGTVFLDGRPVGETPLLLKQLPVPGRHLVTVESPDRLAWQHRLELDTQHTVHALHANLEARPVPREPPPAPAPPPPPPTPAITAPTPAPVPPSPTVQVRNRTQVTRGYVSLVTPRPLRASLGSENLGMTPLERLPLPVGEHIVVLRDLAEGFSRQIRIDVREDEHTRKVLADERGTLNVIIDPVADVYLGTRSLGPSPIEGLSLLAGDYALTIKGRGGQLHKELKVTVPAGGVATIRRAFGERRAVE